MNIELHTKADPRKRRSKSRSYSISRRAPERKMKIEPEFELEEQILSVPNISQWIYNWATRSHRLLLEEHMSIFTDLDGIKRYSNWKPVRETLIEESHLPSTTSPMAPASGEFDMEKGPKCHVTARRLVCSEEYIEQHLDKTGCLEVPVFCVDSEDIPDELSHLLPSKPTLKRKYFGWQQLSDTALGIPKHVQGVHVKASFLSDWQRLWTFLEQDAGDEVDTQIPLFRQCIETFFHRRTYQLMIFLYIYNIFAFFVVFTIYPQLASTVQKQLELIALTMNIAVYLFVRVLYVGGVPTFIEENVVLQLLGEKSDESSTSNFQQDAKRLYTTTWATSVAQLAQKIKAEFYEYVIIRAVSSMELYKKRMSFYQWLNISLKFLKRYNGIDVKRLNFNRRSYRAMLIFAVIFLPLYFLSLYILGPYLGVVLPICEADAKSQNCDAAFLYAMLTVGSATIMFFQYIYAASIVVALVGLAYGGEVAFRLTDSWIQKFQCLRRVGISDSCYIEKKFILGRSSLNSEEDNDDDDNDANEKKDDEKGKESNDPNEIAKYEDDEVEEKVKEISQLIIRDASEHYLFICEAMRSAGYIWSPALTGFFVLALYIAYYDACLYYYTGNILDGVGQSKHVFLLGIFVHILVRCLYLFIYPIICIAHANSCLASLNEGFRAADSDDYEALGGRDRWLRLFGDTSASWTYYGIKITPERLTGISWTVLTVVGSLVLSYINTFVP